MRTTAFDVVLFGHCHAGNGRPGARTNERNSGLRDIPVIVISAVDDIDSVVRCEMGAVDYLPKPYNPTVLNARVRTGLQRKKIARPGTVVFAAGDHAASKRSWRHWVKLSAGMAHELNNPVAALFCAVRSICLKASERQLAAHFKALDRAGLSEHQIALLESLNREIRAMRRRSRANSMR